MRVILKEGRKYLLRFDPGDEVIEGLKTLCNDERIDAGFFRGLGAVKEVTLSWYDTEERRYRERVAEERLEVTNLVGNIAIMGGEIIVHAHGTFADRQLQMYGGHVKRLVVSATCEVVLESLRGKVERDYDEETGLHLLK